MFATTPIWFWGFFLLRQDLTTFTKIGIKLEILYWEEILGPLMV